MHKPVYATTFRSLMNGYAKAEILNLFTLEPVRELSVDDSGKVHIVADHDAVTVPLDTRIIFEPWFMDRGSLLFDCKEIRGAKIATELDIIRYPDGTQRSIEV